VTDTTSDTIQILKNGVINTSTSNIGKNHEESVGSSLTIWTIKTKMKRSPLSRMLAIPSCPAISPSSSAEWYSSYNFDTYSRICLILKRKKIGNRFVAVDTWNSISFWIEERNLD